MIQMANMLNAWQVERLLRFLGEILAVSRVLAGARERTLVAKAAMSDTDKQAQATIAQLLRGDMQGLAASGAAAAVEGAAAAAEGATEGASSSSPTLMCLLLLVLRATASKGQARNSDSNEGPHTSCHTT